MPHPTIVQPGIAVDIQLQSRTPDKRIRPKTRGTAKARNKAQARKQKEKTAHKEARHARAPLSWFPGFLIESVGFRAFAPLRVFAVPSVRPDHPERRGSQAAAGARSE